MILLELFAGTRSISKAFEKRGYKTFSIEWNKDFENIDLYEDINNVLTEDIIKFKIKRQLERIESEEKED